MATMVTPTCVNDTLCVRCLPCFHLGSDPLLPKLTTGKHVWSWKFVARIYLLDGLVKCLMKCWNISTKIIPGRCN